MCLRIISRSFMYGMLVEWFNGTFWTSRLDARFPVFSDIATVFGLLLEFDFRTQVSDWTSVLLASLSLHCWMLPSNLVDCVVPKNHAGLSTHAAPGSPLTFIQKVAHWLKGGEWELLYFYLVPAINNAIDHWLPKRNESSVEMLASCTLWLPRSSVHHPNQVSDWTSVLIASLSLHCWMLPSNLVDCVVPKNHAGLSTHAAPGSPLTFIQKVAHRSPWRSSSKGRLLPPTTKGTGWTVARIKRAPIHAPCHHNRPDATPCRCRVLHSHIYPIPRTIAI